MSGLTIAAVQSNSKRGDIINNVKNHLRLTKIAAKNGVNIIIFPELSLTGYEPDIAAGLALKPTDSILSPLQEISDRLGINILVGAPYRSDAGLHIAAFYYSSKSTPQIYTKHYIHDDEKTYFVPGSQSLSIELLGEVITVAICYDVANPEHAKRASEGGATIYAAGVMISPEGYPKKSNYLKTYAEEYGMITILSNYAGPSGGEETGGRSAVWDTNGKLLAVAPEKGEFIVLYHKNKTRSYAKIINPSSE